MNAHQHYEDQLPLYAAGRLGPSERAELKGHLETCKNCRADLKLWQSVGKEVIASDSVVQAPRGLAERALERVHSPQLFQKTILRAFSLSRAQAYLVRREMWPAAAIMMVIGVAVTLLFEKVEVVRFIAPLVAAASLAAILGPEHDPACELTLATSTSPWKVLLARLTVVHGYNLILALLASLFLLMLVPVESLGALILNWLGPMTFLSALALLFSLWIGAGNSVLVVYALWLIQYPRFELTFSPSSVAILSPILEAYRQFWSSPLLLIGLGALLVCVALAMAGRSLPRLLSHPS